MRLSASFASLVLSPLLVKSALVELWWNIEWVEGVNPDGLLDRYAVGVNGSWPPPIVNVNETDIVRIHATNQLNTGVGTALHAHGQFFNQTSYFDGAVGITQCPIPQGETFTYEPLNSPSSSPGRQKQWGTYWIHGHYAGQYVDGLRAPFIIHPVDQSDIYHTYDEDYTVILGDWYHRNHTDLLRSEFLNDKNPTGAEPVPESGLMYFGATNSTSPNSSYLPGFNENATLSFVPGKTYRLRLINTSALSMFSFWIDGHDMRIIEVDGVDTEEYPADYVPISVAQRYSVLVTARNDTTQNWNIHANLNPDMFDAVPDSLQLNITSLISYGADLSVGEKKVWDEFPYFDDTKLVPSIQKGMLGADVSHDLNVNFNTRANGQNYAEFNNISFVTPQTPSIFSALSMGSLASDASIYGPDANAYVLNHLDDVQITIYNWDAGLHPFHLHGHQFQVVHKSQDVTSDDPEINPPLIEGLANPMRRDTVTVPPSGSATLRFSADSPGTWFLHCHIEWHLESGLAAVFIEAPDLMQSLLNPPSYISQQCIASGKSVTGNAGGVNSTTDFASLPKEIPYLETGWTGKAIAAFTGCLITALLGLGTVVMYGWSGTTNDDDDEE